MILARPGDRRVPERSFPRLITRIAIFTVALALLLHTSLISMHIWGWDINQELYISNLVIQNSAWDFSIYSNINAMLSIVMLVPIFSIIAKHRYRLGLQDRLPADLLPGGARDLCDRKEASPTTRSHSTHRSSSSPSSSTIPRCCRSPAGDRRVLPGADHAPDHQQGSLQDQEVHAADRLPVLARPPPTTASRTCSC